MVSSSPSLQTLLFLLAFFSLQPNLSSMADLASTPLNDDIVGLIVFKSGLLDPSGALISWQEDSAGAPCSGWAHVQCSGSSSARVVSLSLDSLSLSGKINRGLAKLSFLESLSLSNNNFSGDLPSQVFSLLPSLSSLNLSGNSFSGGISGDLASHLSTLDLSGNSLSGEVVFSGAGNLRYLNLAGNSFSGHLEVSRCGLLQYLNVSGNQFSGEVNVSSLRRLRVLDLSGNELAGELPENLGFLHNLQILRLSGNQFSGKLPPGLGYCLHLCDLDLSRNSFSGELPYTLQWLSSLAFFNLSGNRLTGDFPQWISNLTGLQILDISGNHLAGTLPVAIGDLKQLATLVLSGNGISGQIPATIASCQKLSTLILNGNAINGSLPAGLLELGLEELDLAGNQIAGGIPAGSTRLFESLRRLDLSRNKLSGDIPPEMALYFNLRHLNLSWNELRSRIPPELGYFRNLSVLDLRSSALYGEIPGDLCDSGSLTVLQLDGNSLSGPIPEEISNCSSLHLLGLSHNKINGTIPAAISNLNKLEILNLEFNELTGEIPLELGELDSLLAINISHNKLSGRLPSSGIFQTLDQSSIDNNLGICSPLIHEPCLMNVPKPLVLDPDSYRPAGTLTPFAPKSRRNPNRFLSISAIIAISAAFLIFLAVILIALLNAAARRRRPSPSPPPSFCSGNPAIGKLVLFAAGDNFSSGETLLHKAVELGSGSFGTVYRTSATASGKVLAVKKLLSSKIIPYHDEFDREVRILSRARHPNILPLHGYFWTPETKLLVSDYAAGGNLETKLRGSPPIPWPERFNIAIGVARGLAHLHQAFKPAIIHYNVKPSNILFSEGGAAMVADYGMVRLLGGEIPGTLGYVAPEMACQSLRVNERCDVYGFGVVVLELVTGRRPVEYGEDDVVILVDQVRGMLERGSAMECVDQRMGEFPQEEVMPVLKLGLVCTSQIPSSRPSMAEVVQILEVIKTPVGEKMGQQGF